MFSYPMKVLLLLLCLSVVPPALSMPGGSDRMRATGDAETTVVHPQFVFRPSLSPISRHWERVGGSDVEVVVIVDHAASGEVISARLLEPTGHAGLDAAIVDWSLKARLEPGVAGSGRFTMTLSKSPSLSPLSDNPGVSRDPKIYPVIDLEHDVQNPPSLQPIVRAAQRARIVVDLDLLLVVNERGRVAMVKLSSSTGNPSLDREILAWGRRLKVRTDQLLMARLPIRIGAE
jgi:outer membrane biosynthesis protein TonB